MEEKITAASDYLYELKGHGTIDLTSLAFVSEVLFSVVVTPTFKDRVENNLKEYKPLDEVVIPESDFSTQGRAGFYLAFRGGKTIDLNRPYERGNDRDREKSRVILNSWRRKIMDAWSEYKSAEDIFTHEVDWEAIYQRFSWRLSNERMRHGTEDNRNHLERLEALNQAYQEGNRTIELLNKIIKNL